jgi:hypothetical protein
MNSRIITSQLLFAGCVALLGCAEANPHGRNAISGNVTFQGQPLENGSIEFTPEGSQPGIGSGAVIANGVYTIAQAQGLPEGAYRVAIWAAGAETEVAEDAMPGEPPSVAVERIPPKFNLDSELIVHVASGTAQQFDFKLE